MGQLRLLLLEYILVAVSRTVASGDACFMLSDLYGGEGITPTPTVSSSLTVASASCLQILIGIVVIALAK